MVISLHQQQKQQHNLVMTPHLRQAIELLQYSTYDLYEFIQQQITDNPILEIDEKFEQPMKPLRNKTSLKSSTQTDFLYQIADHPQDPRDELIQAATFQFTGIQLKRIIYCIEHLNDEGFLNASIEEVLSSDEITKAIAHLQKIGPIGLGARDCQECILLQLRHHKPINHHAIELMTSHFDLFLKQRWTMIAQKMNISLEEVKQLIQFIKTFKLRPMVDLSTSKPSYIIPDIVVEEQENGFSYYLNDQYLPKLSINHTYQTIDYVHKDVTHYVQQQLKQIDWLKNSLEMRRHTMTKIINVVIAKQQDFFKKGMTALKPLTLQDVSLEIEMHESTVSRATSNKYIQTPHGIFEFKSLFTAKIGSSNGEEISQQKVKFLLQQYIENENKTKPLSDQKISSVLNENEGIVISRRTISKYREELNIPSSRNRKQA